MEELTNQTNSPSGLYIFNEACIEIAPCFIYEVSAYKYWKNGFCLLEDKYYKSDKLLKIKKNPKVEDFKEYKIVKEIVLLGAPESFIREMELPLFVPTKPKIKNGTHRITKRPVH